jgi:hypothetical protein
MGEARSSLLGDEKTLGIRNENIPGTTNTSDNLIDYTCHLL